MLRVLLVWLVACLVAVSTSVLLIRYSHPFVLASAEARASLEVTEAQLKELKGARALNDAITFAIIGGCIAIAVMLPLASKSPLKQPGMSRPMAAVGLSIALGLAGGALGGFLANQFEDQTTWNLDSTTRMSLILVIAIAPATLAVGGVAGWLRGGFPAIADSVVMAILGLGAAIVIIVVAHGTLTPFEARPPVLPDQPANRILFPVAIILCASLAIVTRSFSESEMKPLKDPNNAA